MARGNIAIIKAGYAAILVLLLCGAAPAGAWGPEGVVINEVLVPGEQVRALEQQFQVRILNGNYWYDRYSGTWGFKGGPAAGLIMPNLNLGGPLRPDASNGDTGVFINGRQLHQWDVRLLMQITAVSPGRYWCDALGNVGHEGNPAVLINLVAAANAAGGGGVRREGILSTWDRTGVAVIGNEVLIRRH